MGWCGADRKYIRKPILQQSYDTFIFSLKDFYLVDCWLSNIRPPSPGNEFSPDYFQLNIVISWPQSSWFTLRQPLLRKHMTLSTLDDYFILLPALLICGSDKKIKQGGVNSIWRLSHTMQLFSALRRGWARRGMSFINQNSYLPILYAHDNFKLLLDHICEPVVVISDNRRGKDMNTKWLLAFFFVSI